MVALFDAVRLDRPLDTAAAADLVDAIAQSVGRNPGALISLARLKNRDEYTVMHAVAVCALMIAMARQLGLNEAHTHEAGLAGLLHDVGKLMVPDAVLNKPDKLTDGEFALIRRHAELGHRMLADQGKLGEIPLDVVLHHHEKVDGSGYPHGLTGEQIGLVAKMGAVCDVYDAITSHRPYKRGWNPAEAVRKMAEWSQGHFDIAVFHALVRTVGIYPIGSLVRMESGRLAVVVEHQEQALTTPKVKVFFSIKSQAIITPKIVDLARPSAGDRIVAREDPAAWGLPRLEELWGAEAAPRLAA
jgi:putative nucleotidyltransferase with HDIG domain